MSRTERAAVPANDAVNEDEATLAERAEKAAAHLNATIRDALLTHIRTLKKPWEKLGENEQRDVINAIENTARDVIREACRTIAERGFDNIAIVLKDFTVKEHRIKGKFEATMTPENVSTLAAHGEMTATIVLASPSDWMQGAWAKADPDQPSMLDPDEDEDEDQPDDDQRRAPQRKSA